MAHSLTRKLDSGDAFPEFTVHLLDGSPTTIKDALSGGWSVLLLYRGQW